MRVCVCVVGGGGWICVSVSVFLCVCVCVWRRRRGLVPPLVEGCGVVSRRIQSEQGFRGGNRGIGGFERREIMGNHGIGGVEWGKHWDWRV